VNRAFFGRLAVTPAIDPIPHRRLDVRLAAVAPRETIPAMALAVAVVAIGLVPAGLGRLSEAASTAMAQLPALVSALQLGGIG
jgi:NAD(P)H-quinone oxidoreductase subunit 4